MTKEHIWPGERVEAENARAELAARRAKAPIPRRCRAKVDGRQCRRFATQMRDDLPMCEIHAKVTFLDVWRERDV